MNRIIAAADAGRQCVRCGADVHPTDGPHLCRDLALRYKRQQQAVSRVVEILRGWEVPGAPHIHEQIALEIIKAIGARDNGL